MCMWRETLKSIASACDSCEHRAEAQSSNLPPGVKAVGTDRAPGQHTHTHTHTRREPEEEREREREEKIALSPSPSEAVRTSYINTGRNAFDGEAFVQLVVRILIWGWEHKDALVLHLHLARTCLYIIK